MFKILLLSAAFLAVYGCGNQTGKKTFQIEKDKDYPRWLKSGSYHTDQTSGITYLGTDEEKGKIFLIADDIGKIHQLKIINDTIFEFTPIHFSNSVQEYLDSLPKPDFEEIAYDKHTGKIFLSIEGNAPDPKKFSGIFYIIFKDNNIFSDSIIGLEKLHINPNEQFTKYLDDNIYYEGLTADENFIYLGLEGFSEGNIFSDSTIIFIIDKKSLKIIKEINTKPLKIYTICGLYSYSNYSLYGVDRNNKKLFYIKFDEQWNIVNYILYDIETHIPNFPSIDYVAAIESITMDEEKNIYLVDDPWKNFFIPGKDILINLDSASVQNFKGFIPIIFKYRTN